ncbi:NAD-dependent epimerase/dehydratase family protein [Acaryochloris marina NIES-2412]|uniref:NAD-dependent epimerase/dehydratase family protein n=1 Tax=Acaryochloris marina TaxID=155978 RepID=UPI004058D0A8
MHFLVMGAARFINYHWCQRLLQEGRKVHGIDNLNGYYDVKLKKSRLAQLISHKSLQFHVLDLSNCPENRLAIPGQSFDGLVHLAAQAGVRYSLENSNAYMDSNLVGFISILEDHRQQSIAHLIFASSSSAYGASHKVPFVEGDNVDHLSPGMRQRRKPMN